MHVCSHGNGRCPMGMDGCSRSHAQQAIARDGDGGRHNKNALQLPWRAPNDSKDVLGFRALGLGFRVLGLGAEAGPK